MIIPCDWEAVLTPCSSFSNAPIANVPGATDNGRSDRNSFTNCSNNQISTLYQLIKSLHRNSFGFSNGPNCYSYNHIRQKYTSRKLTMARIRWSLLLAHEDPRNISQVRPRPSHSSVTQECGVHTVHNHTFTITFQVYTPASNCTASAWWQKHKNTNNPPHVDKESNSCSQLFIPYHCITYI